MNGILKPARLAAYGCVALIIVLSLLPANDMARTGAPKAVEHFVAYFFTAGAFGLAFKYQLKHTALIMLGLCALAAAMEIAQQFSPGRGTRMSDFLASSAGAVVGMVCGVLLRRVVTK